METEIGELIGAQHGADRGPGDSRNGYRPRPLGNAHGRDRVADPEDAPGSYVPSFLQPRKRSEQTLVSVVQRAHVCGVSTRRVDQLVESLGLGISKSEVGRIAGLLDEQVQTLRERLLESRYLYLFVDAKPDYIRSVRPPLATE